MKSQVIKAYKNFLETATPEQIAFVDSVYAVCEEHYENENEHEMTTLLLLVDCWLLIGC